LKNKGSPEVRKSESPEDSLKSEVGSPKSGEKNSTPDSYRDDIAQSEIEPLPTANSKLPTETMEVHHHPEVERKGFKEYLLEGLMIFIAVMMGFFAESLREHLVDRERETQYMQGMVVDLRKDSVSINAEIVYVNQIMNRLDSLFKCLHAPKLTDSVQRRLYQLNAKSNVLVGFEFSDAASVQLKNTGGLRLIQSQKVADAIIHYWQASELVKFDMNVFNENAKVFWNEGLKIFDMYNVKNITGPDAAGIQIEPNARLLTLDKLQLTEYANRAGSLILMLRRHYLGSILKQKVIESDLEQLIKKSYKF